MKNTKNNNFNLNQLGQGDGKGDYIKQPSTSKEKQELFENVLDRMTTEVRVFNGDNKPTINFDEVSATEALNIIANQEQEVGHENPLRGSMEYNQDSFEDYTMSYYNNYVRPNTTGEDTSWLENILKGMPATSDAQMKVTMTGRGVQPIITPSYLTMVLVDVDSDDDITPKRITVQDRFNLDIACTLVKTYLPKDSVFLCATDRDCNYVDLTNAKGSNYDTIFIEYRIPEVDFDLYNNDASVYLTDSECLGIADILSYISINNFTHLKHEVYQYSRLGEDTKMRDVLKVMALSKKSYVYEINQLGAKEKEIYYLYKGEVDKSRPLSKVIGTCRRCGEDIRLQDFISTTDAVYKCSSCHSHERFTFPDTVVYNDYKEELLEAVTPFITLLLKPFNGSIVDALGDYELPLPVKLQLDLDLSLLMIDAVREVDTLLDIKQGIEDYLSQDYEPQEDIELSDLFDKAQVPLLSDTSNNTEEIVIKMADEFADTISEIQQAFNVVVNTYRELATKLGEDFYRLSNTVDSFIEYIPSKYNENEYGVVMYSELFKYSNASINSLYRVEEEKSFYKALRSKSKFEVRPTCYVYSLNKNTILLNLKGELFRFEGGSQINRYFRTAINNTDVFYCFDIQSYTKIKAIADKSGQKEILGCRLLTDYLSEVKRITSFDINKHSKVFTNMSILCK